MRKGPQSRIYISTAMVSSWRGSIAKARINVRTMHGSVTTGGPARPHAQEGGVIGVAYEKMTRRNVRALHLGVAAQAEIRITLHEHFQINRTVRAMTRHA